MKCITLRELCGLVDKTTGKKLPTAKALRDNGIEVVAQAEIGKSVELTVYKNGFFTYSSESGTTVYAVDRCVSYVYDGNETIDMEYFSDQVWTLRLMLAGEDRLENNGNRREEKPRAFSLNEGGSNWELCDGMDFMKCVEDWDMLDKMLLRLTDRQQQIMKMYFVERLTQQQIADCLKIRKQVVCRQIQAAIERLKKNINNLGNGG